MVKYMAGKPDAKLKSTPILSNQEALDQFARDADYGTGREKNEDQNDETVVLSETTKQKVGQRFFGKKNVIIALPVDMYVKLKTIVDYSPYNMTTFTIEKLRAHIDEEYDKIKKRI